MSLVCLICSKPADRNDLVCPRDHASWWSLFNEAEIREFRPILELSGAAKNVPEVFYHRDCRFSFTHKKALDRLKCEHRETTENKVTESGKLHRGRQRLMILVCMKKFAFFVKRVTSTSRTVACSGKRVAGRQESASCGHC